MFTDSLVHAALGDLWANSRILADMITLCDEYSNRFPGTKSERRARDFLVAKFHEYGLQNLHLEPCRYVGWRGGHCCFEVVAPRRRELQALSLVLAPSTPPGGVEAELVYVGKGTRDDFNRLPDRIPGRIVLALTGSPIGTTIHRASKYGYGWATQRGAVGFVFGNETPNQLLPSGTVAASYRAAGRIPGVCISYEATAYPLRLMNLGRVRITVQNEILPDSHSWNIVGDLPGRSEEHLLVGTHWDGHDLADAALDSALGICTVLEVARALGHLRGRLRRTIRFVGFCVEEA